MYTRTAEAFGKRRLRGLQGFRSFGASGLGLLGLRVFQTFFGFRVQGRGRELESLRCRQPRTETVGTTSLQSRLLKPRNQELESPKNSA